MNSNAPRQTVEQETEMQRAQERFNKSIGAWSRGWWSYSPEGNHAVLWARDRQTGQTVRVGTALAVETKRGHTGRWHHAGKWWHFGPFPKAKSGAAKSFSEARYTLQRLSKIFVPGRPLPRTRRTR